MPLPPPPHHNPSYPYMVPSHDSYDGCCDCNHHPVPPPPPVKFPTDGFFIGSGFVLEDTYPYIVDTSFTKYGKFIHYAESVNTKVTQRNDPSCINLTATLDMTDSTMTNIVRTNFLEKYTARKHEDLHGVLPIIKTPLKFRINYTVNDRDGGAVHEGSIEEFVYDNYFHFTDIRDVYIQSAKGVVISNIPQMTFQGLYTITINTVDVFVGVIDTAAHILDDMNPYYTFVENNMRILLQHESIESVRPDYEIMLASCEVNRSFEYHANITTRFRMSFVAFLSKMIVPPNTEGMWSALNDCSGVVIDQLVREMEIMKEEIHDLKAKHLWAKEAISMINSDIETIKTNVEANTTSIDDIKTQISNITVKIDAIEDQLERGTTGAPVDAYTKEEVNNLLLQKVDKEEGKGLSSNDYTDEDKQLLQTLVNSGQIVFDVRAAFPETGVSGILYVATDLQLTYLWDTTTQTYVSLNNMDVEEIKPIIENEVIKAINASETVSQLNVRVTTLENQVDWNNLGNK